MGLGMGCRGPFYNRAEQRPAPPKAALTSLCHAGEHRGGWRRGMKLGPWHGSEWAQAMQRSVFAPSPFMMGSLQASTSVMPSPR